MRGNRMFISLQQLERRPVRFDVDIPPGDIIYDSKLTQLSQLHAQGSARLLNHSLGEIRVKGKVKVTIQAACDRCLEAANFPIENDFDLVYMPANGSSGGEDEIDEGGIEVGFYEGNGLVLNEILREVVLLALPMQIVCKADCKGMCPVCGQNRNLRDCGCHTEAADDRWSKLREFRAEVGPHN